MKMEDLYFGIMAPDLNGNRLKLANLFGYHSVLFSVAKYVEMRETLLKPVNDPLFYCFGDFWARAEYEMLISDLGSRNTEKYDIYELYVKPNAKLLMSMVESVDIKDAKKWLREDKKRRSHASRH